MYICLHGQAGVDCLSYWISYENFVFLYYFGKSLNLPFKLLGIPLKRGKLTIQHLFFSFLTLGQYCFTMVAPLSDVSRVVWLIILVLLVIRIKTVRHVCEHNHY
jgi:hypothetical protein